MKKAMKKTIALFAALIMMVSMCMTVFAAVGNSITVSGGDNDLTGVTFNAYKLFDITGEGTDGKYGHTPTANFEAWLNGQAGESDESVYDYVNTQMSQAATAQTFLTALKTEIANKSIKADATAAGTGTQAVFSSLSRGYYVIYSDSDKYTPNAVNLVDKDETVYVKTETPSIDKTAGTEDKDWADAQIGTEVPFEVTVQVPNPTGMDMNSYTFRVVDKMSKGLTFQADSVTVKIGETVLVKDTDYTVTSAPENSGTKTIFDFVITGENGKSLSDTLMANIGKNMTISYSAVLNSQAVVKDPETNEASLEYTDKNGEEVAGEEAPTDTTKVYTYEANVVKRAETSEGTALAGAEFEVYKKGGSDTPLKFVQVENGYRIAEADEENALTTLVSGDDGKIHFYGLEAGDYYLKETKAPDGYNKLKDPIEFTITYNEESGEQTKVNDIVVINKSGSLLPETGGAGSVLFAVIGGIIVLGAAVVLIRNRKHTES